MNNNTDISMTLKNSEVFTLSALTVTKASIYALSDLLRLIRKRFKNRYNNCNEYTGIKKDRCIVHTRLIKNISRVLYLKINFSKLSDQEKEEVMKEIRDLQNKIKFDEVELKMVSRRK